MSPARVTIDLKDLIQLKVEAKGFSFHPRQPLASLLAGRHMSRLRGRGLAFEELRHYYAGDDIRTIDWRATARLRTPHVRVYSEERERPVMLVVDQRSPMFFGSKRAMKSVAAAELAALAAWRSLDGGERVGGLVFGDNESVFIRPRRGSNQVLRLFYEITRFNKMLLEPGPPAAPAVTLNQVLEVVIRQASHDHLVILVTDLDGADERTRELSTRIAQHNDLIIVAVYDPLGAQLSGGAGMRAKDRGGEWEIPPGQKFETDFKKSFQQLVDHWGALFRDLRIPIFPLSTADPVIEQIQQILGKRG